MCLESKIQELQMQQALLWLDLIKKSEDLSELGVDVGHNRGIVRHAKERYAEAFANMVKRANNQYPIKELDITEAIYHQ